MYLATLKTANKKCRSTKIKAKGKNEDFGDIVKSVSREQDGDDEDPYLFDSDEDPLKTSSPGQKLRTQDFSYSFGSD